MYKIWTVIDQIVVTRWQLWQHQACEKQNMWFTVEHSWGFSWMAIPVDDERSPALIRNMGGSNFFFFFLAQGVNIIGINPRSFYYRSVLLSHTRPREEPLIWPHGSSFGPRNCPSYWEIRKAGMLTRSPVRVMMVMMMISSGGNP